MTLPTVEETTKTLSLLQKVQLLITSTENAFKLRSFEVFKQWFSLFLIGYTKVNETDDGEYSQLLQYWSDQCFSLQDVFLKTLPGMDDLIKGFQNEHYRLTFIHDMISLCFQTENIYLTIFDGLINMKNNIFLTEFVKEFEKRYLTTTKYEFKQIPNDQAPLMNLLNIHTRINGSSELINALIELTVSKTEITTREILIYLLDSPTNTSRIYIILFDEYLKNSRLRALTIKQLIQVRQNCDKDPLLAMLSDFKWNSLTEDQQYILEKTWSCPGLFDADEVKNKIEIKETASKISECLGIYCHDASDLEKFVDYLNKMNPNLESEVSEQIKPLLPLVNHLNLARKLNAWERFLAQTHAEQLSYVTKGSTQPETTTADSPSAAGLKDVHFKSDEFSRSHHGIICQITKHPSRISCHDILSDTIKILRAFTKSLLTICLRWQVLPISNLLGLFSDAQDVDHDSEVLNPFLQSDDVVDLKSILDFWNTRAFINNLCNGYIKLCTKYDIAIQDKLTVFQNILEINDQTLGENCVEVYRDYCAHNSNKCSESIKRFINQFRLSEKLFDLLYSLDRADIDDLLEVVNNWDETLIDTKTVLDFVLLKRFLDRVDNKMNQSKDPGRPRELNDLINCFQELLNEDEFKDITTSIKSPFKNLWIIEGIHLKLTYEELSERKRILNIMTDSECCFVVLQSEGALETSEHQFDAYVITADGEQLKFNDLSDLRDRARLIQNASYNNKNNVQNYSEHRIIQLGLFISLIDEIQVVLTVLTTLNTAGYPVTRKYLTTEAKFKCCEGKYDDIHSFTLDLLAELTRWEEQLCAMYTRCINLTYLSHQQISMIQDTIRKKMPIESDDPTYHLLKFMGTDPMSIKSESMTDSEDPFDLFNNIVRILGDEHDAPNFRKCENETMNTRIFVVEISDSGILRAILSLFNLNNISTPTAQQLLYCTRSTTWVEIRAFVYRCFYLRTLHQLIRPERLSTIIQDRLVQLLNQLIKSFPEHFFRLGFITNVSCSDLYFIDNIIEQTLLKTINDKELLNESVLEDNIRKLIGNRCMLVTSRIAGLGKSRYIQKEIQQSRKTPVKFPISGDIDIDTLMQRLRDRKIQSASSSIAIHMDIGPITNVQQLDEFLYCFIIFRCFRFGQIPVDVPTDIRIYIELDSSLHLSNLKDEIVIFKYLEPKYIERFEWKELDITSNHIQLVANYLQAIEQNNIDDKDVLEETMNALDQPTCIHLLKKYLLSNKNSEFISWTRLSILVSVYYKLFSDFSTCGYFMVDSEAKSTLRSELLKMLLDSAKQFTSGSVETVRQNQRVVNSGNGEISSNEYIIGWGKVKPFWLIFDATNDPLFVYKTKEDVPLSLKNAFQSYYAQSNVKEVTTTVKVPRQGILGLFLNPTEKQIVKRIYPSQKTIERELENWFVDPNQMTHEQFFRQLILLSNKYSTLKPICESCFRQYDDDRQHCTKCSFPNTLVVLQSREEKDTKNFHKKMAAKLEAKYILTADNYIKMLLIYLRVQSKLPVLVMGETGCGKTALINCLCQIILNDDLEVFHIHAGVTNEKIIETMRGYIDQAQKLLLNLHDPREKHSQEQQNKRLWIFFDELNTTPNIGLLKEIICERTLLGERLLDNMVFVGACNPLRHRTRKGESTDQIAIKKYHSNMQRQIHGTRSPLLYSVVPLPETMVEYVLDYGSLDSNTEKKYIEKLLNKCKYLTTDQFWFECSANLISKSHKYFREHDDVSSVSLRDVARFCHFYNWFYKFPSLFEGQQTSIAHASLLALFLCYYFRLDSSKERKRYMETIEDCFKGFRAPISITSLSELLHTAKKTVLEQMELPPGMAKNQALLDNIFVLFVCILNRIPVVLSGKPGSSKTSAVQILISSLKEKYSKNEFLKELPALIGVSYQGSLSCTSQSIIRVFEQADKVMEAKHTLDFLPVIVFDEIGLAEISPNNPLKVLHSYLEIEKCRYGFVGLSNWRLDAAKMNRAVYLSCPEPDENDLKNTADCLSDQIFSENNLGITLNTLVIEGLVTAYMRMCEHMQKQNKAYYFGLRDYYSLIRGILCDMCLRENHDGALYQIIRRHLAFNFGGITDASEFIWSQFCESMKQKDQIKKYPTPTIDKLLDRRLSSRDGRYLILIGNSESDFNYIQQYFSIKHPSIQTRTLMGSTLVGDLLQNSTYTEQYTVRKLMEIIDYTEGGFTVFFRGLGHLYDNLYDLFNQNFAFSGKKKYCRIALGSTYHPRCIINDNFYCVIFVKKEDLHKYDPLFLNRFEKHLIDMKSLITTRQNDVMSKLKCWIDQLIPTKSDGRFPCRKHFFVEFDNDYIRNLTINAFHQLNISDSNDNQENEKCINDVIKFCKDQMILTSSFDFPLFLSLNTEAALVNDSNASIQLYYDIHNDLSFASFINKNFVEEKMSKLLVYTYTQLYHEIDYKNINNDPESIEELKLNHFTTELELIQKLRTPGQSNLARLLCIRVDYHQNHQHIPLLKHLLHNEISSDTKHGVCLIFHLQRHKLNEIKNDVYFDGWSRVMIDDLQKHPIIPQNILMDRSYKSLIDHLDFLNVDTNFDKLINRCMINLRYRIQGSSTESIVNERRDRIIQQLTSQSVSSDVEDESLSLLVKQHLLKITKKIASNPDQTQFADWRRDLFTDETNIGSCYSFNNALRKTVVVCMERCLSLLLYHMESYLLIDSYMFRIQFKDKFGEKLRRLWTHLWSTALEKIDISMLSQNNGPIDLTLDLHLPYAMNEYGAIRQIRRTIAQSTNDDNDARINLALDKLIKGSFYGKFIEEILDDSKLLAQYCRDQLILTRNEANIPNLSISFIQHLLEANASKNGNGWLRYLLLDSEELFDVLRIFEISIPHIGEEDTVSKNLHQQFVIHQNSEGTTLEKDDNLYQLISQESNYYLIAPGSSDIPNEMYKCNANPFIEVCLMNLIEYLLSSTVIHRNTDIEQLIIRYSLLAQNMIQLNKYEIKNLRKFIGVLRLASCISVLFADKEPMEIFKTVYKNKDCCAAFTTCDQIHCFITNLKSIINPQQTTVDMKIILKTSAKLEIELLRNCYLTNIGLASEILELVNKCDKDLWKYSARIFSLIDNDFKLSKTIKTKHGQIGQEKNIVKLRALFELNYSMKKIEILLTHTVYIQLIFGQNYQPIENIHKSKLTEILAKMLPQFKESLNKIDHIQDREKLERIGLVAWLKYYLLHYIYAFKDNSSDSIMQQISTILKDNTSAFCSTVKLYIIKQLCQLQSMTVHGFRKEYMDRKQDWFHSMITQSSDQTSSSIRWDVILPTPLFQCRDEFIRIDEKITFNVDPGELKMLIGECSKNQNLAYSFLMYFIHYYTRFYMKKVPSDDSFVELFRATLKKELNTCFGHIGYYLIHSLCTNFHETSYFHLKADLAEGELHQRLLILNVIAVMISFKFLEYPSLLSSLLYDKNLKEPNNYNEHFDNLSYLPRVALANDSVLIQMTGIRNHLRHPITRHFMNFMMDAIFLFLYDSEKMPDSTLGICTHFQQTVQTDCMLLRKQLCDASQYYIWLYRLINNMICEKFTIRNHLNSSEKIFELERLIEEQLIIPNIGSVIGVIKDYKVAYANFVFGENKRNHLINFVNEVVEDNQQYPILQYFNLTNIHSIDIINNFSHKLLLQANYTEIYPLTTFIMERLSEFHNIRHLYPIIRCINYLMQKFDYQIKRTDANKKTINEYLEEDPNFQEIYDAFLDAWYAITLEKIQSHRPSLTTDFKKFDISMFLLDKSEEPEDALVVTCLQVLSGLQNDMITSVEKDKKEYPRRVIPVQIVQQKQLFKFDKTELRELLVKEIMVINYEYGMSEEIIYNFEEIEWILRNEISCLPKIDTENIRYFNYASELYGENESLITEVRKRFQQTLFDNSQRKEIQDHLNPLKEDFIDEIKKSLEDVLSLLRNASIEHSTIQAFIKGRIQSPTLTQSKLNEEPFSSTKLTYIIDLYEILEEYVFDKSLRKGIKPHSRGDEFSNGEKQTIINQFMNTVLHNDTVPDSLKDFDRWIGMLKRLLVRLLSSKTDVSFELPLQVYVNRSDMWKSDVLGEEENIRKIKIDDDICLKHAFIILQGLEGQRSSEETMDRSGSQLSDISSEEDEDIILPKRM